MGRTAAKPVFGNVSVALGRGSYTTVNEITYVYTYHPSAALRSPELGKFIMEDLQLAHDLWKLLKWWQLTVEFFFLEVLEDTQAGTFIMERHFHFHLQ